MDGRNREMKTTFQQWELIINFMEENPSLLKNKFKNFDGDREDGARLWHELTMKLNSMGLGTRSTEKWQLAIGRWKSKTKAKASQLRIEMERTGGGPVKAPPLNQVEERLMALLGWKSVTGDKNLELGLPPLMPLNVTDISSKTPEPTTSRVEVPSPPSNEQVPSLPSNPELPVHKSVGPLPQLAALKRKRTGDENIMPNTKRQVRATNDKSKKFVTLTRMHSDTMQRLQSIDKNIQIMANALQSISQNIEKFVNHAVD